MFNWRKFLMIFGLTSAMLVFILALEFGDNLRWFIVVVAILGSCGIAAFQAN